MIFVNIWFFSINNFKSNKNMAIVDSVAIGSARKSAGDLVYQHYYGRTIAHHKALKDATKKATDSQKLARTVFAYKIYVANQFKIIVCKRLHSSEQIILVFYLIIFFSPFFKRLYCFFPEHLFRWFLSLVR